MAVVLISRKIQIALACIVGVTVGLLTFLRDSKPLSNGQPLSKWVSQMAITDPKSADYLEAERAIQQIGTNALPLLIKWIAEAQPHLSDTEILPNFIAMAVPVAFTALGARGEPAIPALTMILTNGNPTASACAARALANIGKSALPSLVVGLKNSKPDVRIGAAQYMIHIGTDARSAIPELQKLTNDPDAAVRRAVGFTLEVLSRKDGTNAPPQ